MGGWGFWAMEGQGEEREVVGTRVREGLVMLRLCGRTWDLG